MPLSYSDVRDMVSGQLGTCQVPPATLELTMLGILEDVKNRIGDVASKNTKEALVVQSGVGTYDLPSSIERVSSIENDLGEELWEHPYPDPLSNLLTTGDRPNTWHMDNGSIVLNPTPVSSANYLVRGTLNRERILYDVSDQNVKIWRLVDLPEGLHFAYAEAVLAQAIMGEDPGRAEVWATSAMNKISNWKRDQMAAQGGRRRPLKWAGAGQNTWGWGTNRRPSWTPNPVEAP